MRAITMALILSLSAGAVSAKPHLRDVPEVDGTLLAIFIADRIRKRCPSISARLVKAYGVIGAVEDRAAALGYTKAEIDAYRNSEAEEDRLKGKRNAYLESRGAHKGNPEAYCEVGRTEIKKGSQIGALLRMN